MALGRRLRRGLVLAALATGCGRGSTDRPPTDRRDAGTDQVDAAPRDGGFDAGAVDAGPRDTGMTFDAGRDAGTDAGPPDAGPPDVGVDAGPRRDLDAAIRSVCAKLGMCLPYYDAAYCIEDRLAYASGLTPACADASAAYYDCAYSVTCEVYNDSYAWFAHLEVDCGAVTDARDFECF